MIEPLRRDASLGYQVNLLARLFEQALRARIADHGVVPGQFPVLLSLYEVDGLTQAELCRQVSVEQPTMARTLQRMERDGLVRRVPDPSDGRRVRVHLTARAHRLEATLAAAGHEVNRAALRGLTASERRQVEALLARLAENVGGAQLGATTSTVGKYVR